MALRPAALCAAQVGRTHGRTNQHCRGAQKHLANGEPSTHGPDGLIDRKSPGQPSRLNDAQRAAIAAMVDSGPIPAIHGVVRWRVVDLCQWVFEEFRVVVAKQTLSRELRAMGYRKLSARPRHHAQAEGAIEEFKKTSPRSLTKSHAKKASSRLP
jgi:transposase